MEIAVISDIGQVRHQNEDYADIFENSFNQHLLVLCDGLGGYQSGNVASQMVTHALGEKFVNYPHALDYQSGAQWLKKTILEVNQAVYDKAQSQEEYHGMGTTLAAVLVLAEHYLIVHVGDSRVYGLTPKELKPLTEDHSLVNELLKSGQITQEEADNHPNKNMITRSIGNTQAVEVDECLVDKDHIEQVLICSDGLSSMVAVSKIRDILEKSEDVTQAAEHLVAAANDAGGKDNITIIIYQEGGDKGGN